MGQNTLIEDEEADESTDPSIRVADRQTWRTPDTLFDGLHSEFNFTLDAAANAWDSKCDKYISPDEDSLITPWGHGQIIWCNPPFAQVMPWMKKALVEQTNRNDIVFLLKAATDTRWFHQYVIPYAEWWLFDGRVHFEPPPGIKASTPSFGAMLVRYAADGSSGFRGARCPKTGRVTTPVGR